MDLTTFFLIIIIFLLGLSCTSYMLIKLLGEKNNYYSLGLKTKLIVTGIISYISDTIGIGSFASNLALCKVFKLASNKELLGLINGAQIIPGTISSILFLSSVKVDKITLLVLIIGASIGGFIGAIYATKIKRIVLQITMLVSFSILVAILSSNSAGILNLDGNKLFLSGYSLLLGFIGLFIAGFLSCIGVGIFAVIQSVLFLLGMSPIVAFPIMTTSGAIQQIVATTTLTFNGIVPLKKSFFVGISGIIGVIIGFNLVKYMNPFQIRILLIFVIVYNIFNLLKSIWSNK